MFLTKHRAQIITVTLLFLSILIIRAAQVAYADSDWEAKYWNNRQLSGDPVLVRQESELNYDWGDGSPAPEINSDEFSARWQHTINVSEGMYRFIATTDDGMRVWVDDVLIVDSWYDSQEHVGSGDIYLTDGNHQVKVEYYEYAGTAVAKLSWHMLPTEPGAIYNWRGEYFNNTALMGPPVMVRDDLNIDFDWGTGSPAGGVVAADQFSTRWTRDVQLNAGRYLFLVTADDGVRLWVNGALLIDEWRDQAAAIYTAEITLSGGAVPIKMEYYENQGGAKAQLSWTLVDGTVTVGGWLGQYYNNRGFIEPPALVREDAQINFDWGQGSPAPGLIYPDQFTVRWTRTLNLDPGRYRFTATTDDGFRLWVNDELLVHGWYDHAAQPFIAEIDLPGGATTIKMEYYENMALAEARLTWTQLTSTPTTPGAGDQADGLTATVINARYLNVRSGPGFEYDPFTYLTGGQVIELTGFRNAYTTWIQIHLPDGRTGWVGVSFLSSDTPFYDLAIWPD